MESLKSAFSVIDQMFYQEIENAEKLKKRWCFSWCCYYQKLQPPQTINPFIETLMDPFKDRFEDQMKEMIRQLKFKKNEYNVKKQSQQLDSKLEKLSAKYKNIPTCLKETVDDNNIKQPTLQFSTSKNNNDNIV